MSSLAVQNMLWPWSFVSVVCLRIPQHPTVKIRTDKVTPSQQMTVDCHKLEIDVFCRYIHYLNRFELKLRDRKFYLVSL